MKKKLDNLTDEELLRMALAGEAGALGELYDRWSPTIYRFARRLSGEESIAEDVTHDVFTTLMRDGHQYEGRGRFSSYLLTMTRHAVYQRMKRERRFILCGLATEDETAAVPLEPVGAQTPDPLAELARTEIVGRVRQAVMGLPLHYREVILLCHLHELSYAEAAEVIGCGVGTVCSRLYRARDLLALRLADLDQATSPRRRDRFAGGKR